MLFSVEHFTSNHGMGVQCGMMLDEFPDEITEKIVASRENFDGIKEIISSQPAEMIEGYFKKGKKTRDEKVNEISDFIFNFFAYRKTRGK